MADNDKPKMSTCPICGYTDTADDADALHMAIAEHIRMTHNLDPATLGGGTSGSVISVSNDRGAELSSRNTADAGLPIIAAAPNSTGDGTAGSASRYGAGTAGTGILETA